MSSPLNAKQQRQRVVLLASHLGNYQIEKLMENLTEGYLRALGESDPERREQVWNLLRTTELQLRRAVHPLYRRLHPCRRALARVSTLPWHCPICRPVAAGASFDARQAWPSMPRVNVRCRNESGLSLRDQGPIRSRPNCSSCSTPATGSAVRAIASARLMARHKTPMPRCWPASPWPTRRLAPCWAWLDPTGLTPMARAHRRLPRPSQGPHAPHGKASPSVPRLLLLNKPLTY